VQEATEEPMKTEEQASSARASNREEFTELSQRIRGDGLLGRRGGYYAVKVPATLGALLALLLAAVLIGDSWWNLLVAAGLAFMLAQVGFISHDAGHRQVTRRRRGNDAIGLIMANLLSGVSFSWWMNKHNRHHAYTSLEGKDPDIEPGALVYTAEQAKSRGPLGSLFARVQSLTLVPLMSLEAINLHIASVVSIAKKRDRATLLEAGLLLGHAAIFFVAPFLILSPLRALAFVLVTQLLLGLYLGASFLTNHVGMPTLAGGDELGFVRRQVLTSRNLAGSRLVGFLFGGLDSQIEHHLFPTMPRPNLRLARIVVREFCAERRIAYAEQHPLRAYSDIFRHLQEVGRGRAATVVD
jgi:fatty acid desaturase